MVKEKIKENKAEYAIECKNLTKKFGSFTAVDSSNLKIKKGELFGFLGPNGLEKPPPLKCLQRSFRRHQEKQRSRAMT